MFFFLTSLTVKPVLYQGESSDSKSFYCSIVVFMVFYSSTTVSFYSVLHFHHHCISLFHYVTVPWGYQRLHSFLRSKYRLWRQNRNTFHLFWILFVLLRCLSSHRIFIYNKFFSVHYGTIGNNLLIHRLVLLSIKLIEVLLVRVVYSIVMVNPIFSH